jgi:hypothetical protein
MFSTGTAASAQETAAIAILHLFLFPWHQEVSRPTPKKESQSKQIQYTSRNSTKWGPQTLAKSLEITPIAMVYDTYNIL